VNGTPAVRVRFAPSPTGSLHVGGARTALFNYLFARRYGGRFVLRIEDTDTERSERSYEDAILADLRWLGLSWNEGPDVGGAYGPYRQSERTERYHEAAAILQAAGVAYACYCSPEELDAQRTEQERRGLAPRYPGTCRRLTAAQRAAYEAQGRRPALRFCMPQSEIVVHDIVRGEVRFPAGSIGDFVIIRSDGRPAYNFAAVVDDDQMAISHVIRADEHLPNTPRQIALYEALARPQPAFAHVSMILAPDHQKLSKRHGAASLADFREQGYLPQALVNYLALLGWSPKDNREIFSLDELAAAFSLEHVQAAPAVFDAAKLRWFNAQHIRRLPADEWVRLVRQACAEHAALRELPEVRDPAWVELFASALRDHVEVLTQVPAAAEALMVREPRASSPAVPAPLDAPTRAFFEELRAAAVACASREEFARIAGRDRLTALGARHGLSGRALFRPLRLALTGEEHGMEMPVLLQVLGPQRVAERLAAVLAAPSNASRVSEASP
jgi:nondiscriminating glutamyl-tRNA synthetase